MYRIGDLPRLAQGTVKPRQAPRKTKERHHG